MLYIHQYPDWTQFRYDFQSVTHALGETRFIEGKLVGIADMASSTEAASEILAGDIVANFAIDNIALDKAKVISEIAKKNEAENRIKNILGALLNAQAPLTEDRLFAWHAAIGQNKVKKFRSRDSEVEEAGAARVIKFKGVDPERIPHEMERFFNWFETSKIDGAIKAAIAQFWFLSIRPFDDGNGRIARTLSAMLLARSENTSRCQYALNAKIFERRSEYLAILNRAQSGNGDLTEWILWFLRTLRDTISESLGALSMTLHQMQFRQKFSQMDFGPRERRLLEAVMAGKLPDIFSVREAAALMGVSHDSALRDIQALIEKGAFRAEKKGGRSQKYSLVK